jgi:hypothetical protein
MTNTQYIHLTTQKVAKNTEGHITYSLLKDAESKEVYITLVANDGGGYFSREIVPFSSVEQCLAHIDTGKGVRGQMFKDAFVGRSSNNPGFLLLALKHEGLLTPAGDASYLHHLAGDWAAWKRQQLLQDGVPYEPLTPKDKPVATIVPKLVETHLEQPSLKVKKARKLKREVEEDHTDADATTLAADNNAHAE